MDLTRRTFIGSSAAFAAGCVGFGGSDGDAIAWRPGHSQVHYIFTGRGESMFHIFPDGTSMLLDVGDSMRFYGMPKETPHLPDISRRAGEWVARYVERANPKGRYVDDPVDMIAASRDGTSRNVRAVYAALQARGTEIERFRLGDRDQFRQLDAVNARRDFSVFNLCANGRYVRRRLLAVVKRARR